MDEKKIISLIFFGNMIIAMLIIFLWFRYGPFDKNTPSTITALVVVLSIITLIFFSLLQFVYHVVNYCSFIIFFALLFGVGACLHVIFIPPHSVRGLMTALVGPSMPGSEPSWINVFVMGSMFLVILSAGHFVSLVGEAFSSTFWDRFRDSLKKRKFLLALIFFVLAILIYLFFLVYVNLGP